MIAQVALVALALAAPDSRAEQTLRGHHWLHLGEIGAYTQLAIQKVDPWADASWWKGHDPSRPMRPIWGLLWDDHGRVQQVLPGSAADRAGLTEESVAGWVDKEGRGRSGSPDARAESEPTLTVILRDGSRRSITRSAWNPPTIWRDADGRIRIYFLDRGSGTTWIAISRSDRKVLDLRGCRGGYLAAALQILGTFLGPDRLVASYRELDAFDRPEHTYLRTPANAVQTQTCSDWQVLVDRHTASAGELLATALAQHGATVRGGPTFGKHCTQDQIDFPDGAWIRFTVGEFGEGH